MAKKIVWRSKASYEFDAIIAYLTNEWGENVAANFVVRAYQIIDTLSHFPEMGTMEDVKKQIRGFLITKHNTLFYRIEGEKMILIKFFDNRQHPKKRVNM